MQVSCDWQLLSIWSLGYYPLPEFFFSLFTQLGTWYPLVLNSFHFLREPSLTNWKEHSSPHFPTQYFNSFIYLLIVIQSVLPEWKPLKARGFSHLISHCLTRYTLWKDIYLYFTLNVIYFDGFSVDAGLFIWIPWFSWGEFWFVH